MKQVLNDFISADFHVHTPASSCYKGDKTDDEYIDILKRYIDKQVKIIAITDHNTIKGYKHIIEIKDNLIRKSATLKELLTKYPELQNEIDDLNNKLTLFDKILILPGIEFEANPGIHLLFIFDPNQNLNDVETFIEKCGYSESSQGLETASNVNVDVLEAIAQVKELNALTIGAHIDSDKGIYNDLKGNFRLRVLTSDNLDGISINSVIQIEKIKNLLNDPKYKRNTPLAIIQASDHHEKNDCAKHLTYLKVKELNFSSIVSCFKNPNESISSTERPEIVNIIKHIADDNNTICFEGIDEEQLCKALCALLNNGYGSILIGITSDKYKNIKGIKIEKEKLIESLVQSIINKLSPEKIFYSLTTETYPYGQLKVLQFKVSNISNKQFYYKSNYYSWVGNELIENNLEQLSNSNKLKTKSSFDEFHLVIDSNLGKIKKELELLMVSKNNYDLLYRLNENSIKMSRILSVELAHPKNKYDLKKVYPHGIADGNVFYGEKTFPRYPDVYLRCSCPITDEIEFTEKKVYKGEAIIIVPDGATFIVDTKNNWNLINLEKYKPLLVCKLRKEFKDLLNLYTLIGWFKSSLFLWYIHTRFNSLDIHNPNLYSNIFIPTEIFHNNIDVLIRERVLKIIENEKLFLNEGVNFFNTNEKNEESLKVYNIKANKHNDLVDQLAYEIDELIYNCLNINDNEMNMINIFLENKDLYNLNKKNAAPC